MACLVENSNSDAICSRSFTLDIQISSKDKPEVYLCIEGTVVFLLLLLKWEYQVLVKPKYPWGVSRVMLKLCLSASIAQGCPSSKQEDLIERLVDVFDYYKRVLQLSTFLKELLRASLSFYHIFSSWSSKYFMHAFNLSSIKGLLDHSFIL